MMPWMPRLTLVGLLMFLVPAVASAQRLEVSVPVEDLERAAHADSTDALAQYNLALGYWSKKRWDEAIAALDRAIVLEPRFALAYLAKAYLPFARRPKLWDELAKDRLGIEQRNQLAEMERAYRQAFFFDPMVDLRIVGATVRGKSALWDVDPYLSRIWDTWVRGFEDFRDARYEDAYRRFNGMIEGFTATGKRQLSRVPVEILWHQALAAAHIDRHEEALELAGEVLTRVEEEERAEQQEEKLTFAPLRANEYRYVLGVLAHAARQPDAAIAHLEEAAGNDLGLYMAHVRLANLHEQRGNLELAVRERRAALAANPEDPTSAIELAITLSKTGNAAETEALLTETARTNPLNARAHYLLGIVHQQLGRPAEARTAFEHFLTVVPSRFPNEIADANARLARLP